MKSYKILISYICFLLTLGCSFDNKTGIWNEHNKKVIETSKKGEERKDILKKIQKYDQEIISNNHINISSVKQNSNWKQINLLSTNNVGNLFYENKKNKILKSKKIGKSYSNIIDKTFEPLIVNDQIYFYDPHGNIYNYSILTKNLKWKFNFYKKKYKFIPIKLNLIINNQNLLVSDNLGYIYNVNINTGKLLWAKNQGIPFNSEIKVSEDKVFMLNQDNKFYIFNKNNGNKILDFETFPEFLETHNKQSLSIDSENLYFSTTSGRIFSINYNDYKVNWLTNIKKINVLEDTPLFFSSSIVRKNNSIFISTSQVTLSLNSQSGKVNWEFPIGTNIRPININNLLFLTTKNGYIICLNSDNGKVIWSNKLFNDNKKFQKKTIGNFNSLLIISNQIFITTENGYFLFINPQNGKLLSYAKVTNGFFSNPSVSNGKIYIVDKNLRVLSFN